MTIGYCARVQLALLSLLGAFCLARVASAVGDETSDADLLRHLSLVWDHQRSAVTSAVIEFRSVVRHAQPVRPRSDVAALVCNAAWITNEAELRQLILQLDTSLQGSQDLWSIRKFTTDGIDARDDTTSQATRTSLVRTGGYLIRSRDFTKKGHAQIYIESRNRSNIGMTSLSEFNHIPSQRFIENGAINREVELPAGRDLIKAETEEIVANEQTGFVSEYRMHTTMGNDEVFQFDPVKYGDGVLLPSATFAGRYVDGSLKQFMIILIDSATINQPIGRDAFKVAGNQGDLVVDMSDGGKIVSQLGHQVADVINP